MAVPVAPPARTLWSLFEVVHSVTYFAHESNEAAMRVGYRGFWMGYMAFRAAPLGPAGAPLVTALFFNFDASRVARALPDAWSYAAPESALRARAEAAGRALERHANPLELAEAADLLWSAAAAAEVTGRPLAACNQALPRPGTAAEALWQATTTLREQRGDGHVAALVSAGIGPVPAHLLKIAAAESDAEQLIAARAWDTDAWGRARADLVERNLLTATGVLTDDGVGLRDRIEAATDAAAASPWTAIGPEATARTIRLLGPIAAHLIESGVIPLRNPTGVQWPPAGADAHT